MRRVFNLFHKKKHSLVRDLTFKSSSNDGHDNAAVVTLSDEDTGDATTNTCDIHTDQRISALFNAIQRHDVEDVKALVQDSAIGLLETPCGGLTPLLVACHTRHLPILKLLLQHHARTEAEDHQGSTALHTAICDGWIEGVTELLKHGASPCLQDASAPASALCVAETPLRAAVRTGNVTVLQLILKHHPNTSVMDSEEGSLLHLAARSHQPHMVKFLLMEHKSLEILRSCGQNGDSVMHAVLQKSSKAKDENPFLETLRMFFEAGVDVNVKNNQGETPLFLAARRRLPKCTELLISFGADLFAMTQWGQSVLHGACLGGCALCLNILLKASRLDHLVTLPDLEGVQPFHCAVRSSSIDCCELLLTNGDHLTHTDAEGTSRCSLLLQHFPSTSSSQLLTRIFNSHISLSDDPPYDRNSHVIFDYSQILSSSNTDIQSSLIEDINYHQRCLLQHPLVASFVSLKWVNVKWPFYSVLVSFFLFILIHTIYIVDINNKCSELCMNIPNLWGFNVLHLIMYLLILWQEIITFIANPKSYFCHWETLTKMVSLSASAYVVFSYQSASMAVYQDTKQGKTTHTLENSTQDPPIPMQLTRKISAVSVFFGWLELMMLCGRLPLLGSHVLIFTRIAKSALRFIVAFISLLIGFSVSFMVLFSDNEEFQTLGTSFVKTLMMMIGEVDYSSLVDRNTAIISYLILVVFLFLVCILMANLLIGLAVDDIYSLKRIGNTERCSKQAGHIVTFEKMISAAKRFRLLPRRLATVLIRLNTIKQNKSIYINKPHRKFMIFQENISSRIIKEALSIAKTNQALSDDSLISLEKETQEENTKLLLHKLEDLKEIMTDKRVNLALRHYPYNSRESRV